MRVWVTRDEPPDGPLTTALRAAGLTPVHEPVLTRRVIDNAADLISQLSPDDWLVLTSPYAVESVAVEPARIPKVAVVGESSAKAAQALGFRVELVSEGKDAKSLFNELQRIVTSGKVCYPRSSLAKPRDAWADVELISPVLYETTPREFDASVLDRIDIIAVTSPSAVTALYSAKLNLGAHRFASIGPTTSTALRQINLEPWLEAPHRSFDSLADAIYCRKESGES